MASLAQIAGKCYGAVVRVASHLQPVFILVIRLYWGWQFFVSGKAKLLNTRIRRASSGGVLIRLNSREGQPFLE
jgi:uncharacterized membrane protein YphA (DoxX/SURF4 family)